MNSKAFKWSWIILFVTSLLGTLGGLLMIFVPTVFMESEILGYMGQSWAELQSANSRLFTYFLHDIHLLGYMQVASGVLSLLIVWFYYRKGDKVAWWLVLVFDLLAMLPSVFLNVPVGDPTVVSFVSLLTLAGFVALALGAKPIFTQGPKLQQPNTATAAAG